MFRLLRVSLFGKNSLFRSPLVTVITLLYLSSFHSLPRSHWTTPRHLVQKFIIFIYNYHIKRYFKSLLRLMFDSQGEVVGRGRKGRVSKYPKYLTTHWKVQEKICKCRDIYIDLSLYMYLCLYMYISLCMYTCVMCICIRLCQYEKMYSPCYVLHDKTLNEKKYSIQKSRERDKYK